MRVLGCGTVEVQLDAAALFSSLVAGSAGACLVSLPSPHVSSGPRCWAAGRPFSGSDVVTLFQHLQKGKRSAAGGCSVVDKNHAFETRGKGRKIPVRN